jgi:hypothetical protein
MTATTTAIKTLAELNANPYRRTWGDWTIETRYEVGRTGSSRMGTSGAKVHLLIVEVVVAKEHGDKVGETKIGGKHGIVGVCNQNGQRNGREIVGYDTDKVTCTKCLARLGR